MKFDISKLEDVTPKQGGKRSSAFSLGKSGYFRINKYFVEENKLEDMKYVKIKAIKEGNKIIIAFNFLEYKKEGCFSLSYYEKTESFSFSGRGIFSQFGMNYKKIGKIKDIKPEIQLFEGDKYFVVEIQIEE